MSFLLIGVNHSTAPVAIREQVAFRPEQIREGLPRLCQAADLAEAMIVSTCNRTEIYTVASNSDRVLAWWLQEQQLKQDQLAEHFYFHHGLAVVKHFSQVASGLNSMVLGEPQVLGQVKDAYQWAEQAGTMGNQLRRLCHHGFSVAKKIRTETAIGQKPVSIAFTAVHLIKRIFTEFLTCKAVLIGAGETIALVTQHLAELGVHRFVFVNRSLARAEALAERWHGEAFPLSELDSVLDDADIVMAATDSPTVLLTQESVAKARRFKRRKPLLLIDLAVPRNLDPQIAALADCYLYGLDDLQQLIEETLRQRKEAAAQAEAIIEMTTQQFQQKMHHLAKVPQIKALYQQAEQYRDQQVSHAMQRIANGVSVEQVVQQLAHRLTQQLLHLPVSLLKESE